MFSSSEVIIAYLTVYAAVQIICCIYKFKIEKYSVFFYFLFVLSLSALTFHLEPKGAYDIYRYFIYIEQYGSSAAYYSYYHGVYLTSFAFVWDALCRLAAVLNNEYILPATVIFSFYGTIGLIIKKSGGIVRLNRRVIVLYFFFANAMMGINNIFGALRYTLAYILVSFLFLLLSDADRKNKWAAAALLAAAQMIHPSILTFGIVALLAGNKLFEKQIRAVMLIWSFLGMAIARVLVMLPFPIFSYYGRKLSDYFWVMNDDPRSVAAKSAFFIVIILMCIYVNKKGKQISLSGKKYLTYLNNCLYFVVGSVALPDLFIRSIGFIGFLSLPLFGMCYYTNKTIFRCCAFICIFLALGLYAYNSVSLSLYFNFI